MIEIKFSATRDMIEMMKNVKTLDEYYGVMEEMGASYEEDFFAAFCLAHPENYEYVVESMINSFLGFGSIETIECILKSNQ